MHPIRVWSVLGVSSLLLACLGCGDLDWNRPKRPPESKPVKAERGDPLLEDTIGKRTLLGSAQPVTLRGFGVVIDATVMISTAPPLALGEDPELSPYVFIVEGFELEPDGRGFIGALADPDFEPGRAPSSDR